MCGRYTITHSTAEILERFKVLVENISFAPSYNVAPSHTVPIIVAEQSQSDGEPGARLLQLCKWGLLPFWIKELKGAKPLINARAETLMEKAALKQALTRRRCVIPVDGFYEWKKDNRNKIPMRMRLSDEKLFGLAGIYQDWRSPEGEVVRTFAIITVPANELMVPIHDRMPAILTPEMEDVWLNADIQDESVLNDCLQSYALDDLEAYAVSSAVNSPAVNSPELLVPELETESAKVQGHARDLKPKRRVQDAKWCGID